MKSIFSSISAVVTALAACTCCIGPLMALVGMLGVSASQLVWLASIKNYLIAFSLSTIAYNLYRAYYPKEESCCSLTNDVSLNEKELKTVSFFQSKTFLWTVAILTVLILILPYLT